MKLLLRIAIPLGIAMGAVLAFASPAAADTINDSIEYLKSHNTYVEAGLPIDANTLSNAFADAPDVAVVAVSGDTLRNNSWSPADAATRVHNTLGYETVILVQDDSPYFAVRGENAEAISKFLYDDYSGSAYEEILKDAQAIVSMSTEVGIVAEPIPVADGFDPFLLILVPLIIGTAALAVATWAYFRSRRAWQSRSTTMLKDRSKRITDDNLGRQKSRLRDAIERFRKNNLPEMAKIATDVFKHLDELLVRLNKRQDPQQLKLAQLEYATQLEKLNEAFGEEYYLYIHAKPDMWNDPKGRKHEVEQAAEALNSQLVENIRQVNERNDLDFRVALESMVRSADGPKAKEMIDETK